MKKSLIVLGLVLGGVFLAEAAMPTLSSFFVGTPVTVDTGVTQPKTSGSCRLYGTSYNTLDEEHLVAWRGQTSTGYEVRLQRLDSEGNLVGTYHSFAGFQVERINPQVAYSPLTNEYLLVYEEYSTNGAHSVHAQRVGPSGNQVGFAQSLGDGLDPHVTWGGSRWLVVWREESNGGANALKGDFVDTAGIPDGSELDLAAEGMVNNKPARVAYNPASDNFLVVAQKSDNDTFFGYLVENGSGLATDKVEIAKPSELGQAFPDVAADPDPSNPRFLVCWGVWILDLQYSSTGLWCEIQGQFVRTDGTLEGSVKPLQEAEENEIMEILSSLAYSPESREYLLGYEYFKDGNEPNPSPEFRVSRLDQNGTPLESEIAVSGVVSSGLIQPTVGAGVGGRFLTLWQDGGFLTAQIYESPNYDPNGEGSVHPGPYENLVEGQNGDSAINDTLCGGSAVNREWNRYTHWALLLGLFLLMAGRRRTIHRSTTR
jgi:hypothetical protein